MLIISMQWDYERFYYLKSSEFLIFPKLGIAFTFRKVINKC